MNETPISLLPFCLGFGFGAAAGALALWGFVRGQQKSQSALGDSFKALAADSLRANNEAFLQLAETRMKQAEITATATLDKKAVAIDELMKPMKETLFRLDTQIQAIEIKREGAYRELVEMVRLSQETQSQLRGETGQLLQALRTPTTRGRWGEIQLKRILEMTGMAEYAHDFSSQHTLTGDDGVLRPDFIVNLPNQRCIIVDSKVPLASFLDAVQAGDEAVKQAAMRQHAKQVREHVRLLSAKAYWDQVPGTPEFVVLFMPGDHFLAGALDVDPELMDFSVSQKVILATPMTLVALLRTVAYGWRQESLHENTRRIGALGGELYASLVVMTEHIVMLGARIKGSVEGYNSFIGSLERNVLAKARRLREFGAAKDGKGLPDAVDSLDVQPRSLALRDNAEPRDEAAA